MNVATIILGLLLCTACPLMAQTTGSVSGKVVDQNNRPVSGASVRIDSVRGTRTKPDGSFKIRDIAVNTYTMKVTYVGMKSFETEVTIKPGEMIEVALIVLKDIPISKDWGCYFGPRKKAVHVGTQWEIKGSEIQEKP